MKGDKRFNRHMAGFEFALDGKFKRSRLPELNVWLYSWFHLRKNIACLRVGSAWHLFATNIFMDKYGIEQHTQQRILYVFVKIFIYASPAHKHAMFEHEWRWLFWAHGEASFEVAWVLWWF